MVNSWNRDELKTNSNVKERENKETMETFVSLRKQKFVQLKVQMQIWVSWYKNPAVGIFIIMVQYKWSRREELET